MSFKQYQKTKHIFVTVLQVGNTIEELGDEKLVYECLITDNIAALKQKLNTDKLKDNYYTLLFFTSDNIRDQAPISDNVTLQDLLPSLKPYYIKRNKKNKLHVTLYVTASHAIYKKHINKKTNTVF